MLENLNRLKFGQLGYRVMFYAGKPHSCFLNCFVFLFEPFYAPLVARLFVALHYSKS